VGGGMDCVTNHVTHSSLVGGGMVGMVGGGMDCVTSHEDICVGGWALAAPR